MICKQCGMKIADDAQVCDYCGSIQAKNSFKGAIWALLKITFIIAALWTLINTMGIPTTFGQ